MLALTDAAIEKGAKDKIKADWNTYHCQDILFTAEGRIYAPYCRNRFWTCCCGIRKAELINKYKPVVTGWKDPHFVNLVIKAVPAHRLPLALKGIQKAFRQIRGKYSKQA